MSKGLQESFQHHNLESNQFFSPLYYGFMQCEHTIPDICLKNTNREGISNHSSVLCLENPGRDWWLLPMGSHRAGQDQRDWAAAAANTNHAYELHQDGYLFIMFLKEYDLTWFILFYLEFSSYIFSSKFDLFRFLFFHCYHISLEMAHRNWISSYHL